MDILKFRRNVEVPQVNNVLRMSQSLNVIVGNIMIADEDNIVTYLNDGVLDMLKHAESDIRKDLPGFSAGSVLGSNIDIFHKKPAHQRQMLSALTECHIGEIYVGGRTFKLVANPIFDEQSVRIGTVVQWSDLTDELIREKENKERDAIEAKLIQENARIRLALNRTSTNVMIANNENEVIYVNEAVTRMLQTAEKDLNTVLPHFRATQVVGTNIDDFHQNPAHQRGLLANLISTYQTEITVAGRTFGLIANPIFDDQHNRLGTVVEWLDRTDEVKVNKEIESILDCAARGDLVQRIETTGKEGFFANLAVGINSLLNTFESVVDDITVSIGALADGDLRQTIEASYEGKYGEVKDGINETVGKLTQIVDEIAESSANVRNSSEEIASGNLSLSQRTEEQAASLEQISSAMEEITATTRQNAQNTKQAEVLAKGARDDAVSGGEVVTNAVVAMTAINDSSKKISEIISVIDEIAFQTNLLALNASVEAARAGDQGRGFAVVADEVRNLAGRSAKAAKEIKSLIEDSSKKVEEGSILVNQSGDTLNEIVSSVKKVSDIVSEISFATDEQATGVGEVSRSITQMDEMTQQNAALVEESAAASESLGDQARGLDQLMAFFNTGNRLSTRTDTAPVQQKTISTRAVSQDQPTPAPDDDEWGEF